MTAGAHFWPILEADAAGVLGGRIGPLLAGLFGPGAPSRRAHRVRVLCPIALPLDVDTDPDSLARGAWVACINVDRLRRGDALDLVQLRLFADNRRAAFSFALDYLAREGGAAAGLLRQSLARADR